MSSVTGLTSQALSASFTCFPLFSAPSAKHSNTGPGSRQCNRNAGRARLTVPFSVLNGLLVRRGPGAVVCLCDKTQKLSDNVTALPVWDL